MRTGFIGAGNMGAALLSGYQKALVGRGAIPTGGSPAIIVYDQDEGRAKALAALEGVEAVSSLSGLVSQSDLLIIAIKPKDFDDVVPLIGKLEGIAGKIFVTIAAGVSIGWMQSRLGPESKIVRVMPNTPALVGEGASALARSGNVTDDEFRVALDIFGSVGMTVETDESLMDVVTGVSGSSPAFAYMYMKALMENGVRNGLPPETARALAAQATLGAARMVVDTDFPLETLIKNVCSPGGTTVEGVETLEAKGFEGAIVSAMDAVIDKSKRMTK